MVGTRRTEHRATGGRFGVLLGRWIRDLVHGRLGAQEGKIVAKTLYEVKSLPLYEVKCRPLYEVKCLPLYEGRFSGDSSGENSGDFSGENSGNFSEENSGTFREIRKNFRQLETAETERKMRIRRIIQTEV